VRIGKRAFKQMQLDSYGELLEAARRGLLPAGDAGCDYAEVLLGLLLSRREAPDPA
jgi:hypothetical protein